MELLEAGIDVWTTLNVQHLESVNDLVQRITGVAVRETVPDHLLDEADEVEFVDLPPEELLRRLAEGKVYVPDQAARAVQQLLPQGQPDSPCASWRCGARPSTWTPTCATTAATTRSRRPGRWPSGCSSASGPTRRASGWCAAARRLAARLRAEWIVVWVGVARPARALGRRAAAPRRRLRARRAARGARRPTLTGASVSEAVLRFARERNVSKLVVGKPAHARWRDRLRGSLVDEIVRASGEIDVFVISGEPRRPGAEPRPARRSPAARLRVRGRGRWRRSPRCRSRCTAASTTLEPRHDLPARGGARGHPLRPRALGLRRGR